MRTPEQKRAAATERMRTWRERRHPKADRLARLAERRATAFWSKVQKTEGCWLWTAFQARGYGRVAIGGRQSTGAHRVAWTLTNGLIPAGMHICHACDNPRCVRPDHLFLGTAINNAVDRERKGRRLAPKGSKHANAKLVEKQVVEIKRLGDSVTRASLSRQFGVSVPTIQRILRGEAWRHVVV